jgi:hypothetical protein
VLYWPSWPPPALWATSPASRGRIFNGRNGSKAHFGLTARLRSSDRQRKPAYYFTHCASQSTIDCGVMWRASVRAKKAPSLTSLPLVSTTRKDGTPFSLSTP